MAVGNPAIIKTFKTATDMSSTDFRLVILSADNTVADATTTTSPLIGIRQTSPDGTDGQTAVDVAVGGTSKVTLGGTVTYGQKLTGSTAGTAIATTSDTNHIVGVALEGGESGDIIECLIAQAMVAA